MKARLHSDESGAGGKMFSQEQFTSEIVAKARKLRADGR